MPSNLTSLPLALVPDPIHFTAAPFPATNTESSVRPTLLKFLHIDCRNSRIAGRPLIGGVPIGSQVVPSSAKVLAKASASIARMARKYARTAREILSGATCSLIYQPLWSGLEAAYRPLGRAVAR